ncbi:MAG: hypothetical protein U1F54_17985 [Burkholderiales bacterium]
MIKSLHRLIASLLLVVLGVLQASVVLSAHSHHADDAVRAAAHAESPSRNVGEANVTADSNRPTPAADTLMMADCAEHCGGAAILVARPETPTTVSRGPRILPPAINFTAARPERLERPPKPAPRPA